MCIEPVYLCVCFFSLFFFAFTANVIYARAIISCGKRRHLSLWPGVYTYSIVYPFEISSRYVGKVPKCICIAAAYGLVPGDCHVGVLGLITRSVTRLSGRHCRHHHMSNGSRAFHRPTGRSLSGLESFSQ